MLDAARLIDRMEPFPRVLGAAVGGLPDADARWRPDEASWSVVEIVAHLADEEVEDFGRRTRLTLEDPSRPWPGIDPEGAARERRYRERDLRGELARFAGARAESVAWLRALPAGAPWMNVYHHPTLGPMRAGDLLAAWAAHDALHLRQIAKRLHQLAVRDADGFSTGYAGGWGA